MIQSAAASSMSAFVSSRRRQLITAFVVFALIALVPRLVTDVYMMNVLILTLLFAALSQSWNLLGGYCGQVSLGHALYFGIGAYATSILYVKFGITPWGGLLAGGIIAALIALALGYPCFRLKGHYFSIATIVIAEIGLLLFHNWDYAGAALLVCRAAGRADLIVALTDRMVDLAARLADDPDLAAAQARQDAAGATTLVMAALLGA